MADKIFTQYEKNALVNTLRAALACAEKMPVQQTCKDCVHFKWFAGAEYRCAIVGIMPPPDVIAVGCEKHVFDHTVAPF